MQAGQADSQTQAEIGPEVAEAFARVQEAVTEFLGRHPRVHLQCTPIYSSWLNQAELWFAKIKRDVIARGVFTPSPTCREN